MVDMPKYPTKLNHIYSIYIYKEDLALNNQQLLICHKTLSNQYSNEVYKGILSWYV